MANTRGLKTARFSGNQSRHILAFPEDKASPSSWPGQLGSSTTSAYSLVPTAGKLNVAICVSLIRLYNENDDKDERPSDKIKSEWFWLSGITQLEVK